MQLHKNIHIVKSLQPIQTPKLAKEYVFPYADKGGRRISTCGNNTYPKVAVQLLNQVLCIYQSLRLVDSEVLRNRHLRVAAKR
jgi:hypothetical protein